MTPDVNEMRRPKQDEGLRQPASHAVGQHDAVSPPIQLWREGRDTSKHWTTWRVRSARAMDANRAALFGSVMSVLFERPLKI